MDTHGHVLVTGGAGFIGSHLVDALLARGRTVTVIDNFSAGSPAHLAQHEYDPHLHIVDADLLDLDSVDEAMHGQQMVFHLAAHSNIAEAMQRTDLDLRHGLLATVNVLEAMRLNGVARLVFASSGSIYGNFDRAVAEDSGPLLPISLYAASKLSSEAFISAYTALFNIRAWMFRFGNVVGNRLQRGVIYDFIQKLRRDPSRLEVLGDGRQTKPYLLVDDCIDGMLHGVGSVKLNEYLPCRAFNLSPRTTTCVSRVAEIVIDTLKLQNVSLHYTGGTQGWPGDQAHIELDTNRMLGLGWWPKHTSDDAVRIAAEHMYAEACEGQCVG